jgi:Nucleoporin protein Ndc1-Nup
LLIVAISQLVVRSALEDNLGLVQWDIGVLMNCLCLTLKTLENYVRLFPCSQRHTPHAFLQQKHVTAEQDIIIKAIKLAICDIVRQFDQSLDQTGLDSETADVCQRVWEMQII